MCIHPNIHYMLSLITGVSPTDFGRSVNPISTGGTDSAHLITTSTHEFSDLPTAMNN